MLTQEQSVEIKVLARQGHGIKFIARELGISRNTVRKYLRKARSLPSDKVRPARPCKIDPLNRAACGCKLWDFEIGYHSQN